MGKSVSSPKFNADSWTEVRAKDSRAGWSCREARGGAASLPSSGVSPRPALQSPGKFVIGGDQIGWPRPPPQIPSRPSSSPVQSSGTPHSTLLCR